MSDFKIVCGTNPRDNRILNLDKVCEITLDEEYLENSNCVRIYTERGENWNFETDLTTLEQVYLCLACPAKVIFSIDFLSDQLKNHSNDCLDDLLKELGLEKVGDRYVPTKED